MTEFSYGRGALYVLRGKGSLQCAIQEMRNAGSRLLDEPAQSTLFFAFRSLRAKLTKIDVTANTSRSSPRV
jgi:hypothetical protein